MIALKNTGHAEAMAKFSQMQTAFESVGKCVRAPRVKTTRLSSGTTVITELMELPSFNLSPKLAFDEDAVPTFGKCYKRLLKQYCKERKLDADLVRDMRVIARDVFAELHNIQLHEITACNVEECLALHTKKGLKRDLAVNVFNAVITAAFKNRIIRKIQDVFFYEYALVVADCYNFSIGERAECSHFKKLYQRYRPLMDLKARHCIERIFHNLHSLKNELRYAAFKPLVREIAGDLITFMHECGLYKHPYSHRERKILVGALVTDTLIMARPKLDVLFIGNVISGLNLEAERTFGCEGIDG